VSIAGRDDAANTGPASLPSRRRAETRRRLLDAAFDAMAEHGFGNATVEQICAAAGYTRGAFYSNFTSLEELFLAMWEQRSAAMLDDIRSALDTAVVTTATDPYELLEPVLTAISPDDRWYRISAEFSAHVMRNPSLRPVMAARERAIADTLMPTVTRLLERVGRVVPDPEALGQALVAVYDGTTTQCLMEPENPVVHRRRTELFLRVLEAYTEPSSPTT
jgi:AcrR family transcriptional regulator